MKDRKKTFTDVALKNEWNCSESACGPGSSLVETKTIRRHIPDLIKKMRISSILDLGCGDLNWMNHILSSSHKLKYFGCDINLAHVMTAANSFKTDRYTFAHKDVTVDPLPKSDLCICRDLIGHLSFDSILRLFDNLKFYGIDLMLISNYPDVTVNKEMIEDGGWRTLNLSLAPFNFNLKAHTMHSILEHESGPFHGTKSEYRKELVLISLAKVRNEVTVHQTSSKRILLVSRLGTPLATHGQEDMSASTKHQSIASNSHFIVDMLQKHGIGALNVMINEVDELLAVMNSFKPDILAIQGIFIDPLKLFDSLKGGTLKQHDKVKTIFISHSELPLAYIDDTYYYNFDVGHLQDMFLASNSARMHTFLPVFTRNKKKKTFWLPNYTPLIEAPVKRHKFNKSGGLLKAGCFGPMRYAKNFVSAVAASVLYAEKHNLHLEFHVNEMNEIHISTGLLEVIKYILSESGHEIIFHTWMPREDMITTLRSMDVNFSLSVSESYCFMAAESLLAGVPTVTSHEIVFNREDLKCDPSNANDIQRAIDIALKDPTVHDQIAKIIALNNQSVEHWLSMIKDLTT